MFFCLILVPFPALFLFILWADTPAAALGKICSDTFLLLDFPVLNQGRGARQDSTPGLLYSSPTR
jgi:hypothetical protein